MFDEYTRSTKIMLDEAQNRNIKIDTVYPGKIARLEFNGHVEYISGQYTSNTSSVASRITQDKAITKYVLDSAGIPVPSGIVFMANEIESAIELVNSGSIDGWVLKPLNGSQGDSVFADISNETDLRNALEIASKKHSQFILEKKFIGNEYRILATKEKVVAVANRIPANVTGDGQKTIKELIEEKNKDPRRGTIHDAGKCLFYIKIDDVVSETLAKHNLSLDSVLPAGQLMFLRDNSNLSTGGDSVDHTDQIHPELAKIAVRAINAIPGLAYGGIDLITKDISEYDGSDTFAIIEINLSPGISMHHFPAVGKPRNVAKEIVDIMFPETKKD